MRRRLATVPLAAMLYGVVQPTLAAGSYAYPCTELDKNYKMLTYRAAGTDYTGVIGDMKANAPGTCTGSYAPTISAILPANLQKGQDYIVQFGLAVCSGSSPGKCGTSSTGVPSDGLLHFVYICDDDSGGWPCLADGWIGGPPEYHDRYRFRIERSGSTWVYTLTNITEGWSESTTIPRSSGFASGDTVWWAAETYDRGSQLGTGQASESMMRMYWMQYYRTSLGAWYVAWPNTQYVDLPDDRTWPSYWHGNVYDQNYTDDAQNIWTTLH